MNTLDHDATPQPGPESVSLPSSTAIFDALEDPVSIFTLDGVYLYLNSPGRALLARTDAELLGRTYLDVYPDLRAHPFHEAFQRVARSDSTPERLEFLYEPMGLWSEQQILRPVGGGYVVVFWRNITARKNDERAQSLLLAEVASHKQLLEASVARAGALTSLASSLSMARTQADVVDVVTAEGMRVFAADLCTIYLLREEETSLELLGERGVSPGLLEQIRRIPATVGADALWVEDAVEQAALLPAVATSSERRSRAFWSVPLIAEGRRVGLLGMGFGAARKFSEHEPIFVDTFAKLCAQALLRADRFEKEALALHAERRDRIQNEFIAAASKELASSSLDYRATLATVARLAVPELADWCAVELLEPGDDAAQQVAVAHAEPAKLELARALREKYPPDPHAATGAPNVIRTGKSELYADIPAAMLEAAAVDAEHLRLIRELRLVSAMVVPLRGRVRTLGALTFIYAGGGRHYAEGDLAFAEDFAHRAALAIENARALKQVEDAKRLLDVVVDRMPSAVVVVDARGERTLTNQRAAEIYGSFPPPTTDGHVEAGWSFFVDGRAMTPADWATVRSRLRGEEIRQEEMKIRRPDGSTLHISVSCSPLRSSGGEIVGAVAVFDDVSSQKHAEAERELFVGMLGHDLRNPLAAISTGATLLERRGDLSALNAGVVTRILSSARRMARMIEQILDFTRARSAGGIPVVRTSIDARSVVANVVAEAQAGREDVRFDVEVKGRTTGSWDADRLEQVFSNLIGNAVEHGGGNPIRIAFTEENDALRVVVHNDGKPIPPDMLPFLFDPFRQVQTHRTRGSGLGLGLYITRQIVLAHGGTIGVESSDAAGTTFALRLPYEGH